VSLFICLRTIQKGSNSKAGMKYMAYILITGVKWKLAWQINNFWGKSERRWTFAIDMMYKMNHLDLLIEQYFFTMSILTSFLAIKVLQKSGFEWKVMTSIHGVWPFYDYFEVISRTIFTQPIFDWFPYIFHFRNLHEAVKLIKINIYHLSRQG